jgi:vacuolar-type H+-ATPase subunit H
VAKKSRSGFNIFPIIIGIIIWNVFFSNDNDENEVVVVENDTPAITEVKKSLNSAKDNISDALDNAKEAFEEAKQKLKDSGIEVIEEVETQLESSDPEPQEAPKPEPYQEEDTETLNPLENERKPTEFKKL